MKFGQVELGFLQNEPKKLVCFQAESDRMHRCHVHPTSCGTSPRMVNAGMRTLNVGLPRPFITLAYLAKIGRPASSAA